MFIAYLVLIADQLSTSSPGVYASMKAFVRGGTLRLALGAAFLLRVRRVGPWPGSLGLTVPAGRRRNRWQLGSVRLRHIVVVHGEHHES